MKRVVHYIAVGIITIHYLNIHIPSCRVKRTLSNGTLHGLVGSLDGLLLGCYAVTGVRLMASLRIGVVVASIWEYPVVHEPYDLGTPLYTYLDIWVPRCTLTLIFGYPAVRFTLVLG